MSDGNINWDTLQRLMSAHSLRTRGQLYAAIAKERSITESAAERLLYEWEQANDGSWGHTSQDTFVLLLTFKQLKNGERFRWHDDHGNLGDAFVWEKVMPVRHPPGDPANSKRVADDGTKEFRWTVDRDRVERAQ